MSDKSDAPSGAGAAAAPSSDSSIPSSPPSAGPSTLLTEPGVRKLALELGVNLAQVEATGAEGVITLDDVRRAADFPAERHDDIEDGRDTRPPPPMPTSSGGRHLLISPLAKQRASRLEVDVSTLTGTGPGGAISVVDVEVAAERLEAPPRKPRARARRAYAAAAARSKREVPHYYVRRTIDVSAALEWLEAHNEGRAVLERLAPGALMLAAVVRAVMDYPELNGHFEDGVYLPSDRVSPSVGIALTGGGVVYPTLEGSDALGLDETMASLRELVGRARNHRAPALEPSLATIGVTSMVSRGLERGAEEVGAVILPPQVAMVGLGAPRPEPLVLDGAVQVRTAMTVSLAGDSRVSDPYRGAAFLAALGEALASPEALIDPVAPRGGTAAI